MHCIFECHGVYTSHHTYSFSQKILRDGCSRLSVPSSRFSIAATASHSVSAMPSLPITAALEDFQFREQRRILDVITQIRKCGLHSFLELPQIAVCGEQSAGKSSVLEALTEILFPRQDNLCTRFATEITLRRGPTDNLTLAIIPADDRSTAERTAIAAFSETIANFADLPALMEKTRIVMGVDAVRDSSTDADHTWRPFARDVLSIVVEGPDRPQFTVVDLPGLVQANTKGVNTQDRKMVEEITDHYIRQRRTICLAVVAATHDYANQLIIPKVKEVDPEGERTLGVITKPDRLESDSGREAAFISLARTKTFSSSWAGTWSRIVNLRRESFPLMNATPRRAPTFVLPTSKISLLTSKASRTFARGSQGSCSIISNGNFPT